MSHRRKMALCRHVGDNQQLGKLPIESMFCCAEAQSRPNIVFTMPEPTEISVAELRNLLNKAPLPFVLDIREAEELAGGMVVGAVHIPMNDIRGRLAELPAAGPIVVYCEHGMRSQMVAEWISDRSFIDVRSLTGGFSQWGPGMRA